MMMMGSKRAWVVFGASCSFTLASVVYVHWAQENDRSLMYRNVLYDIAQEKAEQNQQQLLRKKQEQQNEDCDSGICDLKQTREVK